MAKEKKKLKKGKSKKGSGKAPKKGSAKLKPAAKAFTKKKRKGKKARAGSASVSALQGKKSVASDAPRGDISLSSVMITEAVRNRVCRELKLTTQETGYVTKVITSVWMAADIVQQEPIGNSDSPLMPARTGENRAVDLGTLAKVVSFPELQREVRGVLRQARRASFVGPKGLAVLGRFVDKTIELVTTESTASAG